MTQTLTLLSWNANGARAVHMNGFREKEYRATELLTAD